MSDQAPVMSREEWKEDIQNVCRLYEDSFSNGWYTQLESILDAIMSLQAEVERLRAIADQAEKEAPIFDALMIELRGSWPQYQHYADLLNEARGFEKARQPK